MPTDIRLEVGILDHPKKVKLVKKLGWEAFECLLRLWMYVRERRPKGILTGMSPEDLEIALVGLFYLIFLLIVAAVVFYRLMS